VMEYRTTNDGLNTDQFQVRLIKAIVLVFALNDAASFESIKLFKTKLLKQYTVYSLLPKFLIGLKSDMPGRAVSEETIENWIAFRNKEDMKEFHTENGGGAGGNNTGDDGSKFKGQNQSEPPFVEWRHYKISAKDGTGIEQWTNEVTHMICEK